MANPSFMQFLMQALRQRTINPDPPSVNPVSSTDVVGDGLANRGINTVALKQQYDQYAQDAMSRGEQPVPFDAWVQARGGMQRVSTPGVPLQ